MKKAIITVIAIIGVVGIAAGIIGTNMSEKKDKEYNNITNNVVEGEEEEDKNVDYNTIVGKWYCFENLKETYDFKADGTAFYELTDIDESEEMKKQQREEYEAMSEEDKKRLEEFEAEISNYTYTLEGNKGILQSKNAKYKFEYIKDGENSRLLVEDLNKVEGQVDDGKWTFYKTWKQAKNNSESYKSTVEYLNSIADEDGWAIEDGKLLGYMGKKTTVTVPKNVKSIESGAFSWDLGRAVKVKKITVGGNVKTIKYGSFAFCNADIIVIKNGVEEIEDFAFMDSYIESIYFPKSIKKIGNGIMETEEGLDKCVIHCVKGSEMAKYLEENKPYGDVKIKYDYK